MSSSENKRETATDGTADTQYISTVVAEVYRERLESQR